MAVSGMGPVFRSEPVIGIDAPPGGVSFDKMQTAGLGSVMFCN